MVSADDRKLWCSQRWSSCCCRLTLAAYEIIRPEELSVRIHAKVVIVSRESIHHYQFQIDQNVTENLSTLAWFVAVDIGTIPAGSRCRRCKSFPSRVIPSVFFGNDIREFRTDLIPFTCYSTLSTIMSNLFNLFLVQHLEIKIRQDFPKDLFFFINIFEYLSS